MSMGASSQTANNQKMLQFTPSALLIVRKLQPVIPTQHIAQGNRANSQISSSFSGTRGSQATKRSFALTHSAPRAPSPPLNLLHLSNSKVVAPSNEASKQFLQTLPAKLAHVRRLLVAYNGDYVMISQITVENLHNLVPNLEALKHNPAILAAFLCKEFGGLEVSLPANSPVRSTLPSHSSSLAVNAPSPALNDSSLALPDSTTILSDSTTIEGGAQDG